MWRLDVNLPNGLIRLLQSYEIPCATRARRGWRDLTNGALAEAALPEGFRVIPPGIASGGLRRRGAPGPTDSIRRRPDHLLLRLTSS